MLVKKKIGPNIDDLNGEGLFSISRCFEDRCNSPPLSSLTSRINPLLISVDADKGHFLLSIFHIKDDSFQIITAFLSAEYRISLFV